MAIQCSETRDLLCVPLTVVDGTLAGMDTDHGTPRSEAEENFKAEYGHYPIPSRAARAHTGPAT